MDEEKLARVREFLKEFKKIASQDRGLDVVPRRENINSLAELGLTKKNRTEEIMNLSVTDYCEGPLPDRDRPGEIWIFGKRIGGKEVYIKLKIAKAGKEKMAKCLSFHSAGYPLAFPFQSNKRRDDE